MGLVAVPVCFVSLFAPPSLPRSFALRFSFSSSSSPRLVAAHRCGLVFYLGSWGWCPSFASAEVAGAPSRLVARSSGLVAV